MEICAFTTMKNCSIFEHLRKFTKVNGMMLFRNYICCLSIGTITTVAVSKHFQHVITGGTDGIILVIDFGPEETLSLELDRFNSKII